MLLRLATLPIFSWIADASGQFDWYRRFWSLSGRPENRRDFLVRGRCSRFSFIILHCDGRLAGSLAGSIFCRRFVCAKPFGGFLVHRWWVVVFSKDPSYYQRTCTKEDGYPNPSD